MKALTLIQKTKIVNALAHIDITKRSPKILGYKLRMKGRQTKERVRNYLLSLERCRSKSKDLNKIGSRLY